MDDDTEVYAAEESLAMLRTNSDRDLRRLLCGYCDGRKAASVGAWTA